MSYVDAELATQVLTWAGERVLDAKNPQNVFYDYNKSRITVHVSQTQTPLLGVQYCRPLLQRVAMDLFDRPTTLRAAMSSTSGALSSWTRGLPLRCRFVIVTHC